MTEGEFWIWAFFMSPHPGSLALRHKQYPAAGRLAKGNQLIALASSRE